MSSSSTSSISSSSTSSTPIVHPQLQELRDFNDAEARRTSGNPTASVTMDPYSEMHIVIGLTLEAMQILNLPGPIRLFPQQCRELVTQVNMLQTKMSHLAREVELLTAPRR